MARNPANTVPNTRLDYNLEGYPTPGSTPKRAADSFWTEVSYWNSYKVIANWINVRRSKNLRRKKKLSDWFIESQKPSHCFPVRESTVDHLRVLLEFINKPILRLYQKTSLQVTLYVRPIQKNFKTIINCTADDIKR